MGIHPPNCFVRSKGILRLVLYGSSPDRTGRTSDKQLKGSQPIHPTLSSHPASALGHSRNSWALLRADAMAKPSAGPDSTQDPEALRIMTALSIINVSESGSIDCEAAATASSEEESLAGSECLGLQGSALSVIDELHEVDADGLSLAIGILRQHQPVDADEADIQLSERFRGLLVLLRQRPGSSSSRHATQHEVLDSAAALASPTSSTDEFWSDSDEWSDVRSALMSIGVNATFDEDSDEVDVWQMEEEGPARRTHLLKRLPKLNAATAAQLASFLAELQQREGMQHVCAKAAADTASSMNDGDAAAEGEATVLTGFSTPMGSIEEEQWWEQVTQAYQLLWQQARLQQAAKQPA